MAGDGNGNGAYTAAVVTALAGENLPGWWGARYLGPTVEPGRWPAAVLAAQIRDHVRAGAVRLPGAEIVRIFTPSDEADGYRLGTSSLLHIVTDDRPYLVDSVLAECRGQGWTVRHVYHPTAAVRRDASGRLLEWAEEDGQGWTDESWIGVEVYPPWGDASGETVGRLTAGLEAVLAESRVVAADAAAMRARLAAAGAELAASDDPDERWSGAVVTWLSEDHLTLLGACDFDVVDGDYRPVAGTGLGVLRDQTAAAAAFAARPVKPGRIHHLILTKDSARSRVRRPILRDYVGLRRLDAEGRLVGERRFLGLFTPSAYTESVTDIPGLADLYDRVVELAGYEPDSHGARQMKLLMDTYPRDELFDETPSSLLPVLLDMADLDGSHYDVEVFAHPDPWDRTVSVLVYLPRDRYTTATRERLMELLMARFDGTGITYHTQMGEAPLARLYFRVDRPAGAGPATIDQAALKAELADATRTWSDRVIDLLADWPADQRGVEYSRAYQDDFTPAEAVADLAYLNQLTAPDSLVLSLRPGEQPGCARLKVFSRAEVTLAKVMPLLSDLGVTVTAEWPYEIELRGDNLVVYEFLFTAPGIDDWDEADRARFTRAFEASYRGWTDSDRLLGLVATGLEWTELTWLRALAKYLRQAGLPYSTQYMRQALLDNPAFALGLVAAIKAKFAVTPATGAEAETADDILDHLTSALRDVAALGQDRTLRALIAVVRAMVRTNAFTADLTSGQEAFAVKLLASELEILPEPRPQFEIWVHSPRVEGIHLRFGPVARGGLRWSDRPEDFRTEILGLVKAQMVKNAVIVPVGAKGGFIARQAPAPTADRAKWLEAGQAAYREFIGALLSLTDNLVAGEVVHPAGVAALDGPDPYLVVAADKGTATFSDLANAIALDRGFWLGDAFASGGSHGFDHKAMGITAKGAWESTRRHFHELGLDPDHDDFTVVGIGDMSGDVFGNGMLLSRHIKLVCAFDHRHVFVDPAPDPAASFAERARLFDLPRSSWADYDRSLISPGGGVYPRSAKAIPVTPEARAALGLAAGVTELTPDEYIHAALQAPVDLLWNGGIGTYVKAAAETPAEVGDKANDALRVNGGQVRARCAVEGGNLGWTHRGRIEYALAGGKVNADFIDNSAGVDTSDHEVNIKILLADAIAAGALSAERRDELLAELTDEVARHVLVHNVDQNTALSDEAGVAAANAGAHEDWIAALVEAGYVDRALEFLPTSAEMADRIAHGRGLTNPELASVLSWTKICLADLILASDLPDDPFVADRLLTYFPARLRQEFQGLITGHRLRREITATVAVNRFVDSQGIAAYHRLHTDTGAAAPDVMRAQLAARSILRTGHSETVTRKAELAASVKAALRLKFRHEVERGTRWMLHNGRRPLDIQAEIDRFAEPVRHLAGVLPDLLTEAGRAVYEAELARWQEQGVAPDLAHRAAAATFVPVLLGVIGIAADHDRPLEQVARTFFLVRERFGIDQVQRQAERLPETDRWALRARSSLRDEVLAAGTELTHRIVPLAGQPEAAVARFLEIHPGAADTAALLADLGQGEPNLAPLTVALRAVRSLLA
ncbi:MAG: NAD-glutamate dehydrogenase [Propionibacteriaceae bacterium]|jgi:glutamate dehydrogenase|nr:NAD-glutamate dehydrogenase [Propionibacteriaceae bacterium]